MSSRTETLLHSLKSTLQWFRGRCDGSQAMRHTRTALWLGTSLVLLTLVGGMLAVLLQTRQTALGKAEAEIDRSVRVAENILNRQLLQVDGALASVPTILSSAARLRAGPMDSEIASQILYGLNFQTFAFRDLLLVNAHGEVWATARPRLRQRPFPIDLNSVFTGAASAAARILGPVRNPATGEWAIYVARAIKVPGLEPLMAVAEVPVAALMMPLADIATVPGSKVFVERKNGHIIGSMPNDERLIGQKRPDALVAASEGAANAQGVGLSQSGEMFEAKRQTLYSDVAVVMQVARSVALAGWAKDRDRLILAVTLVGALVIAVSSVLLTSLIRKARLEEAQQQALAKLQEAVESMSDGFVMWDEEDRLVTCNGIYRGLYAESAQFIKPGVTFEELIRRGVERGQYPQAGSDIDGFVSRIVAWHRAGEGSFERLLPDGRWVLVTERRTQSGGTVGMRTDITQLKTALEELADANARVRETMQTLQDQNDVLRDRDLSLRAQYVLFDAALNNMSHGLLMVDSWQRVIVCNSRFRDIFGIEPGKDLHGEGLHEVFSRKADEPQQKDLVQEIRDQHRKLAASRSGGTFVVYMADGCAIAITQRPMLDGGFVAIYEDVTEQKKAESRIRFLAHHDSLTNLPNRVMFRADLERKLADLQPGCRLAVLYLDLDRFKDVNDTLGHQIGDALLEAVGRRLGACLRESDLVARLGGDEFAVALQGTASEVEACAFPLAQRIIEKLGQPYDLCGQNVTVGVSVGVALVQSGDVDVDTLLKRADMALYAAKGEGRGTYRAFAPQMEARLHSRLQIENDLKSALVNDEFRIVYQPLIALASDEIIGFEALLRWECAERGLVSPAEFIPLAEEMNLIGGIGAWCLERACHDMAVWQGEAKIAVNLSPVQLRSDDIVDVVKSALGRSGLSPSRLELEITESALLEDSEQITARLHRLHALGVRIVLDDFGTGFSSLNYLRSFPFDKIKIDKVFVMEATTRGDCEAIVQSVVQLADRLGMITTAEGIETPEQLALVKRLGCTEGQGYLLGRPQSILSALSALEGQAAAPQPRPVHAASAG